MYPAPQRSYSRPFRARPTLTPRNHWWAFYHCPLVFYLPDFHIKSHSMEWFYVKFLFYDRKHIFVSGFPCSARCLAPLYISVFLFWSFKDFFLSLLFKSLVTMCSDIGTLFIFIVYIYLAFLAFWICEFMSLSNLGVWRTVYLQISIFLHKLKFYMLKQIVYLWVSLFFNLSSSPAPDWILLIVLSSNVLIFFFVTYILLIQWGNFLFQILYVPLLKFYF